MNVEACLEGLASPGSGQPRVGEQVRGKLGYHSDDMGEYDVNNIAFPMLGFCPRPEAIADPLSMSVPRPPCRFSESPTTPRPTGGDPAGKQHETHDLARCSDRAGLTTTTKGQITKAG